MTGDLSPIDKAKFVAAKRAAELVEDGMRVGLGTGSTAAWLVRCLGEMVREQGLKFRGVPTSTRTAELARELGIEVISLDEAKWLDLTIDGADEFDAELNLIKGGGGALLQEKIVATASDRMVVITDASKEVETLGAFPLPVEVIPFGWQTTKALIEETLVSMDVLGRQATLRMNRRGGLCDRRGQSHHRSASQPDRPCATACHGAEPDARRGRKRAVHRYLRHGGDRSWRRPGRIA